MGAMCTQSRLHEQSASVMSAVRFCMSMTTTLYPSSVVTVTVRRLEEGVLAGFSVLTQLDAPEKN